MKHSKVAKQQSTQQSPPITPSQEIPTKPASSQTNQPQSPLSISFQENTNTIEERYALLSEPLIPVVGRAPLSESQ